MLEAATPTADRMARIARILRIVAIAVPLLLLATIGVDGISWTDIGVTVFVAVVLWLFVGVASFTVGALAQAERPPEQG